MCEGMKIEHLIPETVSLIVRRATYEIFGGIDGLSEATGISTRKILLVINDRVRESITIEEYVDICNMLELDPAEGLEPFSDPD